MKKHKITIRDQRTASEILTRFMCTKDMDDVVNVWNDVYDFYDLCDDPFTGMPCTSEEYGKLQFEYEKQTMIDRYDHCDGL